MPKGIKGTAMLLEERRLRKKAYMRRWRETHPEHIEKYRQWARGYYREDNTRYLNYARRGALKKKYGLSIEAYERMLLAQQGRCAICLGLPKKNRLAVDHDH